MYKQRLKSVCHEKQQLDFHHNLIKLYCFNTEVEFLDVSNSPYLSKLYCYSTKIIDLDVSNCLFLESLNCFNSPLETTEISPGTVLTSQVSPN